jgi:FixJ family two-component response regulator
MMMLVAANGCGFCCDTALVRAVDDDDRGRRVAAMMAVGASTALTKYTATSQLLSKDAPLDADGCSAALMIRLLDICVT